MARKRLMRWALCMGLVLSMTATQPLAAIAAANENRAMGVQEISPEGVTDPEADTDKEESSSSENEVTQGGQGKKTEQSVTPEENDTDGASEERDKNGDGQRQTVEESADSFGSSNLAGESIQPRISVATNLTDPNQTEGNGCYTIPVTTVPNLKDGTYTVPMRMFKIIGSSDAHAGETTEGFGNPKYAPSSLGSMALDPLDSETQMSEATVTVSGGKVKVAIGLNQTLGCTAFNYYDSYEGFQDGDKRGGTPEDPDGIEYEGGKEVTEWNPDGDVFCIKKANFELPSDNPIVYITVEATGMPGQPQDAFLGFYWDYIEGDQTESVDKTALNEEIQKAEGMLADTEEDYTLKSKADLQTCIDTAKGVAGNRDATEEEVQKAVEDLQEYEKSLVTRRNLAQALRDARTESDKTEVYTSDSTKALENQIEKAQAVYDQEDPTQAEVDQAAEDLRRVQGELERLPAEEPETYPAFHAVDSVTGVELAAAEGVLPEGVKMRVVKVTDADKAKEISSALSNLADKNTAYEITLYVERDGKEESVDPKEDMSLTITLPVPEGYNVSKVACYYIDANQYANTVKGTLSGT